MAGPNKDELQAKARELGLDDSGTKDELAKRIADAEAAAATAGDTPSDDAPAATDESDRKATGDPAGFTNEPGRTAPDAGSAPKTEITVTVIDNPTANDRRQEGDRAPERGIYLDRDGKRRVVAAGDRIPDGWKPAKD